MKDNIFAIVAEAKILDAIKKGELDNLPGEGKPLVIQNLSFIPEEERMAFIVMKNSGLIPREVTLQKEIDLLQGAIAQCQEEKEKAALKQRLRETYIQYDILMEKRRKRNTTSHRK